ncbi:DUF1127 domain-containing protein [Pannonibacter phragmitetus]|uniref:DUF1127 domain-containing protein n=1 Tax=Pannonibacter phragmitetus TaxID=121719 RepID=UPI000F44F891|nr:DUF1127 domain-containing protein [Pannonibacter phragmitetus]
MHGNETSDRKASAASGFLPYLAGILAQFRDWLHEERLRRIRRRNIAHLDERLLKDVGLTPSGHWLEPRRKKEASTQKNRGVK